MSCLTLSGLTLIAEASRRLRHASCRACRRGRAQRTRCGRDARDVPATVVRMSVASRCQYSITDARDPRVGLLKWPVVAPDAEGTCSTRLGPVTAPFSCQCSCTCLVIKCRWRASVAFVLCSICVLVPPLAIRVTVARLSQTHHPFLCQNATVLLVQTPTAHQVQRRIRSSVLDIQNSRVFTAFRRLRCSDTIADRASRCFHIKMNCHYENERSPDGPATSCSVIRADLHTA